ncbi:hypothetical protein [Runella sp.]|uniref:hypothetical protein n=1 Tax=Runella sp. TaxID=1960881 RepID=UPI003D11D7B4
MSILFIRLLRIIFIVLYGIEFTTITIITYNLFNMCLLTVSIILAFFIFLSILMTCEILDDIFQLQTFAYQQHRLLVGMKAVLIITMIGFVWFQYKKAPHDLHLVAELYVIFLIEVSIFVIVQLKKYTYRSRKRNIKGLL